VPQAVIAKLGRRSGAGGVGCSDSVSSRNEEAKVRRELVSFNTRRIVALVVILLGSTFGGLLAVAFTDSRLAAVVGVVLGAVAALVFILIWANRSV
jgi:hypothetical protein